MVDAAIPGDTGVRPRSLFVSARDGLKLHVRSYGLPTATGLPVVCLPGLARTTADFDALATGLAGDAAQQRRVIALDYRGRGLSEYDRDPKNYSLPVELDDVSSVLTALGIGPALFVGTSRGGLLTMLLAVARPTAIAGAILNDIGPVVEPRGLMRIRGYVGKLPTPRSYKEGGEILRRLFDAQFTELDESDWQESARRTWKEDGGVLVPTYDVKLAQSLEAMDLERPQPDLWPQFDALAHVPLMVIRGANSDLLSAATVSAMQTRRPDMDVVEVPAQGHAPLLSEPDLTRRISSFIAFCEISARR